MWHHVIAVRTDVSEKVLPLSSEWKDVKELGTTIAVTIILKLILNC
jgi:hypothetical protein